MDPLLGPARPDPGPSDGLPGAATAPAPPPGAAEGSAQTILDAWLHQLQTDQAEEPVVESRLDLDSLLSSQLEFDLDFLSELSGLRGPGGGDGGVSLQELSQDLELGLLCPPEPPLEPDPVGLGVLSAADPPPEPPPPPPALTSQPDTAPPRQNPTPGPPPVASISVVTNKQQGRTVITISTPRGRQSLVLPTADLTQASRVLRALRQKRRRSRAAAAEAGEEAGLGEVVKGEEAVQLSPPSSGWSTDRPGKRKKSDSDAKDAVDDDPVMRAALHHLGIDLSHLEATCLGRTRTVNCPEPGCDVITNGLYKLKVHLLRHRNYKPYKCSEQGCEWKFFERGKLNRHVATHAQAFLRCGEPDCTAAFRTRTNLQRHRLRVHDLVTPPGPPPGAEEQRAAAGAVPRGVRGAEERERDGDPLSLTPFRCTKCRRTFKNANGLKRHLSWHSRQAASACQHPGCGFTAPGAHQLKLHARKHVKQYPCTYPECTWAFESHAKLKRHLTQHTGRRNFRCPYLNCDKTYRRMEYLSNHIRHHLGRVFRCTEKGCGVEFSRQSSLTKHQASIHGVSAATDPGDLTSSQAAFSCRLCRTRFRSDVCRQIHLQDVHGVSGSKLASPGREERRAPNVLRRPAKFNPECLNWVNDSELTKADADDPTYSVYLPFDVETDSGPSEVLVKCDVTKEECRRLGIEPEPERVSREPIENALAYDHVLHESSTNKETARELRKMGIGVLSAGLRRTGSSGCARTDITSCRQVARRPRPRPSRVRRLSGWPWAGAGRTDALEPPPPPPFDPAPLMDPTHLCHPPLDPPSLLCDSDLLGPVHDPLHSTINLSDLT